MIVEQKAIVTIDLLQGSLKAIIRELSGLGSVTEDEHKMLQLAIVMSVDVKKELVEKYKAPDKDEEMTKLFLDAVKSLIEQMAHVSAEELVNNTLFTNKPPKE